MKYSIFFDSYFIIRKALFNGIIKNKSYISGKVLDFGCGNKPYEKYFETSEYIGVDIENSGHDHSDKKADFYYNGVTLPFKNEEFDSIFSSEVFEHVFNLEIVLKELNRVLKKDGNLLITVPFVWELHEKPYDFARYTIYGLESLLKENGFEVIKIDRSTNYIETLTQMKISYITKILYTKNGKVNGVLNFIFIFPLTLFGIVLSKVLPKNFDFYHNNILVATRK